MKKGLRNKGKNMLNENSTNSTEKQKPSKANKVEAIQPNNDQTNSTPESQSTKTLKRLEISIFFDGTWNNRTNSDLYNGQKRFDGTTESLPRPLDKMNKYSYDPDLGPLGDNISYARLPTTVDRMHRAYKEDLPNHYSLYIDGCGTGNAADIGGDWKLFFADNPIGAGLGWGSTGVKSKIKKAFKQLNQMIRDKTKTEKYDVLVLNLFGFSRGSATARIFANLLLRKISLRDTSANQRQIVMPKGKAMHVQLKFMGIFDCVSSIGFNHGDDEGLDFAQDLHVVDEDMPPSDMGLMIESHEACRIVHLAALTEYRDKFSLYDISSAIEKGVGVEIRIPGCHTDLGDGLGTKGEIKHRKREPSLGDHKTNSESRKNSEPKKNNKTTANQPYWYESSRDEPKITIAQKKVAYIDGNSKYNQTSNDVVLEKKAKSIMNYDQYNQHKPNVFGTKDSALAQMERVDFNQLKANLVAKGLFIETVDKNTQIWIENTGKELKKIGIFSTDTQYQRLIINRKQLSMLYPIIPANIMIELCKRHNLDAFDDTKLFEYDERYAKANDTINNEIDQMCEPGIWGAAYDDMKAQALAWDAELDRIRLTIEQQNQKDAASQQNMCKPFDNNQLIKSIEPQDEIVRKKLYNHYIHWSSQLATEGFISQFAQVSLGQINAETNMFERTIYKG
ncbi:MULTISPECIES: DUF2235 domain-containing protein [Acinetobacter]|uniref:DUF2235 domain-containing protein n=1 Tax=Acinetobacter piscicola TaxID=2006115 RepID=A0A7S6VY53_9GAMM|nr:MULTISPECIES: DUF2235 domain-containing protein [Acinetobacter]QOW47035.1 DUF2235 domain-containing protein [Acinetobacter piscicola]